MQTWGLLALSLLVITIPAYAQISNPQIGNNTISQYCWNGTCQTPTIPSTNTINDTGKEFQSKYNIIMIIPSELCTNAIKNHIKTDCPPLDVLTKYDNSNQDISGKFVRQIDGTLTRSNPQVKNHWQYYGYTNHTIICVYCTGNYLTTDLYKTIILQQSDNFEYAPHTFVSVPYQIPQFDPSTGRFTDYTIQINEQDSGLTTFLNRNVQGCNTANIAYSDELLNDTIQYLESNCTVTHINQTKTYQVPNTPWSYDNPYSSLHYVKSIQSMFKGWKPGTNGTVISGIGLGDCITHKCSATTSSKKPGW